MKSIATFSNSVKSIAALAIYMCGTLTSMAVEKAHIVVNTTSATSPTELVITTTGQDPAASNLRTKPEGGIYEFNVFDLHGATSSAAFLINPEGEIVFTGLGPEEVKEALDKYITLK